jgi:hypothetical protein
VLIAALSALVLQVAPAQYDATFSCDCKPQSMATSGVLTTRAKSDGDFAFDYANTGSASLGLALRAGRQAIADSPGLQPSSKWQSSFPVLVEDQTFVVPVRVSVSRVENGVATIEAQGELNDTPMRLQIGTVQMSIKVDLVERIKQGSSAGDPPSLTSLVENIADHFQPGGNRQAFDATVKCVLNAK